MDEEKVEESISRGLLGSIPVLLMFCLPWNTFRLTFDWRGLSRHQWQQDLRKRVPVLASGELFPLPISLFIEPLIGHCSWTTRQEEQSREKVYRKEWKQALNYRVNRRTRVVYVVSQVQVVFFICCLCNQEVREKELRKQEFSRPIKRALRCLHAFISKSFPESMIQPLMMLMLRGCTLTLFKQEMRAKFLQGFQTTFFLSSWLYLRLSFTLCFSTFRCRILCSLIESSLSSWD